MASLLISSQIELLNGGVPSLLAACQGAVFQVAPGYDLSVPTPITDIVGELIVDGERPFGRRASNRTITLPVVITVPATGDTYADQATLTGARETLLALIDQPVWTLTWTRDGGLPLVFDCFRAAASVLQYSVRRDRNLVCTLTISFQALPYGRSDTPVPLAFASPVTGGPVAPPSPVLLDDFETVTTPGWSASGSHVTGSYSAYWPGDYSFYSYPPATYKSTFSARDITGRGVLQHWLGVAAPNDWYYWGSSGTTVSLQYTLRDSSGHTLAFGTSLTSPVSRSDSSPYWNLVSANLPGSTGSFDLTSVTECDIRVTNYGGSELVRLDVFLDDLTAQPVTTGTPASLRGSLYTLHGVVGTSHAPLNLQFEQPAASTPTVVTITAPGAGNFIPPAGVTTLAVEKWAASAAGGSRTTSGQASGSKGGEYTKNTAFTCAPGVAVPYFNGAGGVPSTTAPGDGGDTWFGANDSTTAHGSVAPAVNTAGAVNTSHGTSTDPVHFAGGSPAGGSTTGGGGGESGGPSGAGNAGGNPAGGTGNADAGDGGTGGAAGNHPGGNGVAPGGGAAGASSTGTTELGGVGANGQIRITYTVQQPLFKTLIAHRPGPDSPTNLTPFVSTASVSDPPDGRQYAVTSQVAGQNADFNGTYTIIAVANSWSSPSSVRTVTITVYEYEYPGGPSSSQSVSRTFVPSTDIVNGLVVVGEMTLPGKDIPPDNTASYFTLGCTDTITADQFLDFLLIDVSGQTVIINEASQGYAAFYLDAPSPDRDLGRVLGTAYNRTTAVSVLDSAFVSGGPLTVDGGTDCVLLAYCTEGAPEIGGDYAAHWFTERLA